MNSALLEEALAEIDGDTYERVRAGAPSLDGRSAAAISLRFAGAAPLDATSADDVALLEAARLGAPVRLIVTGVVSTKSYALDVAGERMRFALSVRVESVEAGELV